MRYLPRYFYAAGEVLHQPQQAYFFVIGQLVTQQSRKAWYELVGVNERVSGRGVSANVGQDVDAVPRERGPLFHFIHKLIEAHEKLRGYGGVRVEHAQVDGHAEALELWLTTRVGGKERFPTCKCMLMAIAVSSLFVWKYS
jgi:hypothetical protein